MLIDLSLMPHHRTAIEPEFTGYLLLDATDDRPPAALFFPQPVYDQTYARFYQDTRKALARILGDRNLPGADEQHGLVEVQVEDCDGFSVTGATLEIWNHGASGSFTAGSTAMHHQRRRSHRAQIRNRTRHDRALRRAHPLRQKRSRRNRRILRMLGSLRRPRRLEIQNRSCVSAQRENARSKIAVPGDQGCSSADASTWHRR